MNGEIPSVPITTLAGVSSLTSLLPQLPLPTPIPATVYNKSLLYHPKLADEAHRLLSTRDDRLARELLQALRLVSTEHIELKDSLTGDHIEGDVPPLLKAVLARDPNVFKRRKICEASTPSGSNGEHISHRASHAAGHNRNNSSSSHSHSKFPRVSQDCYQEQFQSFAQSNSLPQVVIGAVNGECERPVKEKSLPHPEPARRSHSTRGGQISTLVQGTSAEFATAKHGRENEAAVGSKQSKENAVKTSAACRMLSIPKGPMVVLEPLDPQMLRSLAKSGGTVKTSHRSGFPKDEELTVNRLAAKLSRNRKHDDRGIKRKNIDFDEEELYQSSLSDRVKRKRRSSHKDSSFEEDTEHNIDIDSSEEDSRPDSPVRRKKKEKRHKRVNQQALTIEELLDSPTFKKFSSSMEYIFDSAEEVNFGTVDPSDEEADCAPDSLISRQVLLELVGEAAKLKSMGVFNQIPADKLVKLLTILQWNIKDGAKLLPCMTQDVDDEEEQKLWREVTMERVLRSMDAGLTALLIMTSPDMPKQVYIEDVIECTIMFGKFQLQNTIYPEFDPVYRVDPKRKDGYHGSFKLKRARAGAVKHKSTLTLYNKMSELVGNLAELCEIQELTDTTILGVSTLGVSNFFVENISELQLNAMKLVTTVFSHYAKHRQLILEDIFASLARLPSSKRNLRNYRLNVDESIQMVTALALQLIQCVAKFASTEASSSRPSPTEEEQVPTKNKKQTTPTKIGKSEHDAAIVSSYETAMRTGYNFLSVFLRKCTTKGEEDYRSLFENFVQDLLSTVNKPEWPASELLLSLLGRILVNQFSNKQVDMSLRVASLEYLGIVAARLRKDAVSSHLNEEVIDEIVEKVNENDSDDEQTPRKRRSSGRSSPAPTAEGKTQDLQRAILEYLVYNGQSETAYLFACQFYIAQWYRDATVEAEKTISSAASEDEFEVSEAEVTTEVLQNAEKRKQFLLSQADSSKGVTSSRPTSCKLDYDSSCLVARYLSSKRPFAESFDFYLTQILRVLSETAVAVRTKAMKCLTAVIEADPGILARSDMQKGVHGRFLDQSTSVREAAIELVGKFILIRPELIPKYYDMLSDRILDTGISVRKRVIKIFREICIEQIDYEKIPEMCVKMIRRVNDEEGIKKLVNEVFQTMWFTPLSSRDKDSTKLLKRVVNITEVVLACKDTGYEFFENLLDNLLKKDDEGNFNKTAVTACKQIVDCLVENVLRIEEKSVESAEGTGCSQRLVACLSTLYLFSKIKPDLMVNHATTLQPYLDIKCSTHGDFLVLHYVARILELTVPLMDHPSESFLAQLEEEMMKLILKHGMMVLQSCVSCLGAVVNSVSHNYPLVKDCFQKFFGVLSKLMSDHKEDPCDHTLNARKPTLLRSLFTVGLLCKYFDFDSKEMGETKSSVKDKVFDVLMYFMDHEDEDVRHKSLTGIGFVAVRHYEFMLGKTLKEMYYNFLTNEEASVRLRIQVLKNLQTYLVEEEVKMAKSDAEWRKHAKQEDLKDMCDVQSGMASTVMQIYLKQVLESFFHKQSQVRMAALSVITLVLRQGLVHPVQCVPYLISMGTDREAAIRVKSDQQLQDIEKKYPGFCHMKSLHGIKMSYRLQKILQDAEFNGVVRGQRVSESSEDHTQGLNAFLYTMLRGNKSHRRGLLTSLLNLFDDSAKISLAEQLYLADNLAFFPYQTLDEPLFIIHQIDIIVSVSGSNLLQSFKEMTDPKSERRELPPRELQENPDRRIPVIDDDEDDDPDALLGRLPENIKPLEDICQLSQGCILLLILKQHLKDLYGFTDSKIHRYSPTDSTKVYDKQLTRKMVVKFNPDSTIQLLKDGQSEQMDAEERRTKLVTDYLEFKEMMLSIDPPDEDDSDDVKSTGRQTPTPGKQNPTGSGEGEVNGEQKTDIEVVEIHDDDDDDDIKEDGAAVTSVPPITIVVTPQHNMTRHSSRHIPRTSSLLERNRDKSRQKIQVKSAKMLSASFTSPKSASAKKRPKKRRRRYGSDSDDDDESDDDPDFVL